MAEPNTYKITSLEDLFTKIPADRLAVCITELYGVLMDIHDLNNKVMEEIKKVSPELDPSKDGPVIKFPDSFDWKDDGRGEVTITLTDGVNSATVTKPILSED